jgi:predicted DsbA family dithiol-disulfide isomerase
VRIERLRRTYDIEVRWTAFPLHPETPEEGRTLEELFRGRSVDMEGMKQRLQGAAREAGLLLGERTMTFNSRRAQELAKWAESAGRGDEFHDAVFRAYYVEGKNIGKMDVLTGLAQSIGLPEKEARSVLEGRTQSAAVESDWSRCRNLGISAVPTFMAGGRRVVGALPYEALEKFLIECGARKRAEIPG